MRIVPACVVWVCATTPSQIKIILLPIIIMYNSRNTHSSTGCNILAYSTHSNPNWATFFSILFWVEIYRFQCQIACCRRFVVVYASNWHYYGASSRLNRPMRWKLAFLRLSNYEKTQLCWPNFPGIDTKVHAVAEHLAARLAILSAGQ